MGYSTGILKHRIEILRRVQAASKFSAGSGRVTYEPIKKVWADATWSKGAKAMREGALDSYDTVMFRMRYNTVVNRESFIGYENKVYQIMSLHSDYQANTIQITAVEIVGTITRPEPPVSTPALDDTETEIKPEDI